MQSMHRQSIAALFLLGSTLGTLAIELACTPGLGKTSELHSSGAETDTETSATADHTASKAETEATGTTDHDESESAENSSENGANTLTPEGCEEIQCAPGSRECGEGHKCVPWRCGDDCCTNSTRCVELTGTLKLNDECFRDGDEQTDNCGPGLFCMPDGQSTGGGGPGRCVELCVPKQGTAGNCDELGHTGQHCFNFNQGSFPVCLETCDPLARDCPDPADECYLAIDQFFCTQTTCPNSCDPAEIGDECATEHACRGGLICAPSELSATCNNRDCGNPDTCGCCALLCDLLADDPDENCDRESGEHCVPVLANPVDKVAHVGICAVPPELFEP